MASKARRIKKQSILYGGELFPSEGIRKWYKRELSALSTEMSRKTISNLISVYRRENSQIKALYAQDADSAETALTGYLAGAQKQVVFREAVNGAVGDAMPVEKDAAFEKYLKEAN